MKFCLTADGMTEVAAQSPTDSFVPNFERCLTLVSRLKSGAKIVVEHIERNKLIYRIGAITLVVFLGIEFSAFADTLTGDTTGIDQGARKIYRKLVSVGKWVVIIKGAFDAVSSTVQGDFIQARKSFLAALLVYVILLGLPWAFAQVEGLFEGL